jgi:serine/threonine protein phosphatase 1
VQRVKGLVKMPANTKGRDFVVGDLHGCYDKFMSALEKLVFHKQNDRVFCVGDLADRGPDSEKCIELLREPWFFSSLGNHEMFLLEEKIMTWYDPRNGGAWWAKVDRETRKEYKQLVLDNCPAAFEIEHEAGFTYGIVHSECPNSSWEDCRWDDYNHVMDAIWNRDRIKSALRGETERVKGIDLVFHGHTPTKKVINAKNEVWCDLGVCFSGGADKFEVLNVKDIYNEIESIQRLTH